VTQYNSLSFEWAQQQAQDANCDIDIAHDLVLQLDLDSREALDRYDAMRPVLVSNCLLSPTAVEDLRRSRSGNFHVTLTLSKPLPVEERIMLQALLGSDLKREALSLARTRAGNQFPVLLFRPRFLVEDGDGAPYPQHQQWYPECSAQVLPPVADFPPADPDLE
jgi:hypothetical protein